MSKSNKTLSAKSQTSKAPLKAPRKSSRIAARKTTQKRAVPNEQKRASRENSKLANMIAMLRQPKGTTIEGISKATGWQAHSVRGAISGAIKKKLGLTVTSVKADDVRIYRITD